jgi:hypothetical protein
VSRRGETLRRIDAEIAGEKAAALGRTGERLEAALAEVAAIEHRLATAREAGPRARLLEEYEAARRRAQTARLALVIHREALGLRTHRVVDQQFPEPPPRPRSPVP